MKNQNQNQKKLKKLFINGKRLIQIKHYGFEIRMIFIKKIILTFSKA
jgi:hypothetical protein